MGRFEEIVRSRRVGAAVAGVGFLALVAALAAFFRGPSSRSMRLAEGVEELDGLRARLEMERSNQGVQHRELETNLEAKRRETEKLEASVAKQEAKVEELGSQLGLKEKDREKEIQREKERAAEERVQEKKLPAILTKYRKVVVSVITPGEKHSISGFFVYFGHRALVVTSGGDLSERGRLLVSFQTTHLGSPIDIPPRAAKLLHRDEETGLAILQVNLGILPVEFLMPEDFAEARTGERVYAIYSIYTEQLPPGMNPAHRNVFEGTVGSTDHVDDGRKRLLVDVPANPGFQGVPIINRDGKMIGVLIGKADGTVLAVPSGEVTRTLEGMDKP